MSSTAAGAGEMVPVIVAETPSMVMTSLIWPEAASVSAMTTISSMVDSEESALVTIPKLDARLLSKIAS